MPGDGMIFLCITGQPVTKKNSKRIVRFGNRPSLISSAKYLAWESGAVRQLRTQWAGRAPIPADTPVHAQITSYLATRRKTDLSNLYEGPQDAMQRAGILADDCCI